MSEGFTMPYRPEYNWVILFNMQQFWQNWPHKALWIHYWLKTDFWWND